MKTISKSLILVVIISLTLAGCGGKNVATPVVLPSMPGPQNPTALPTAIIDQSPTAEPTRGINLEDFDTFVENSYRALLRRDPETVLELGLSQQFGTPTDQLTDISDEYIHQTQALESSTLATLQQYDRSSLTPEQRLTYDMYAWYLKDKVKGHEFMYDDYPINPTVFSLHIDLLQWFTDLRPVTNVQEAQDYITCLTQVNTKFMQLIDGLKRREENGVILPRFLVEYISGDLQDMARSTSTSNPYYDAFENKLGKLTGISESDKTALLAEAAQAITTSVLPAYQSLVEYFDHLKSVATNEAGVWKFPNGEAYYGYVLHHYTSTDLTPDQIHELGLQALGQIHAEMRVIFDQLGYPQDERLPRLFNRLSADSGVLSGEAIVQGYEDIISTAEQNLSEAFDLRPNVGVIVIGGPTGGYYIAPTVDGSRPGMFYAADTGLQAKFSMPTLAYHEAIPGHHFQIAISQQLNLPSFRRTSEFIAYVEGWALYAEHLVKELGFYDENPYGDLGRLQAQAFRAARLVVDSGLHAKKWTFNQAVDFMVENTGMPESMMQSEVSRYISIPGQATAYYIGYTTILQARQRAQEALGDQFDLKEFHNILLGSGAMPLETLEQVITSYIQSAKGGP